MCPGDGGKVGRRAILYDGQGRMAYMAIAGSFSVNGVARLHTEILKNRELMIPVFQGGKKVYTSPKVMDIQKYCRQELATLWEESLRLEYPHRTHVDLSLPLWKMKNQLLDSYHFGS